MKNKISVSGLLFLIFFNLFNAQKDSANFSSPELHKKETPVWRAKRLRISIGFFLPVSNTAVSLETKKRRLSTLIDLEDHLGFEKISFSSLAKAEWRISKRSELEVEYFILRRGSGYQLKKDLEFGNHTYTLDSEVESRFNLDVLRATYQYGIIVKPRFEAGLLIGSHIMFGEITLAAKANTLKLEYSDRFAFWAPLPDVGLWTEIALGKKFGLNANVSYLALKINNIRGRISGSNLMLKYNAYKNLNINLGYSLLSLEVDIKKKYWNGILKWGYNGPSIIVSYTIGNQIRF